jgi:hypothetical protein
MRVAFHTLGCKVNHYETEALREAFVSRGAVSVPEDDPADTEVDVSRALNEYFASRPEAPKAPKESDKAPEDKSWPKE